MRRSVLQIALAGFLLTPAPALAQGAGGLSGLYGEFFGGATYLFEQEIEEGGEELEIDYDFPGYVFGGKVGYALDTNIRLEGEVSYAVADGDASVQENGVEIVDAKYDLSILSATAGVQLDLWPVGILVPYVGAGLGYARAENEVNNIKDTQNAFTAYGESGLPFALTPALSVVPAVRFNWVATDKDVEEIFADNLFMAQFRMGLRYTF